MENISVNRIEAEKNDRFYKSETNSINLVRYLFSGTNKL